MADNFYGRPEAVGGPSGVWTARVISIGNRTCTVEFDHMLKGQHFTAAIIEGMHASPALHPTRVITSEVLIQGGNHFGHIANEWTGEHSHGNHHHDVAIPLKAGDHVVCALMNGRPDRPVVLGRLL